MSDDIKDVIVWIPCIHGKPKVPEGKHSIPVLVIIFDAVYEGINPLKGEVVRMMSYAKDGTFRWREGDEFVEYKEHDPITHWCYLPRTPQVIKAPQVMW